MTIFLQLLIKCNMNNWKQHLWMTWV